MTAILEDSMSVKSLYSALLVLSRRYICRDKHIVYLTSFPSILCFQKTSILYFTSYFYFQILTFLVSKSFLTCTKFLWSDTENLCPYDTPFYNSHDCFGSEPLDFMDHIGSIPLNGSLGSTLSTLSFNPPVEATKSAFDIFCFDCPFSLMEKFCGVRSARMDGREEFGASVDPDPSGASSVISWFLLDSTTSGPTKFCNVCEKTSRLFAWSWSRDCDLWVEWAGEEVKELTPDGVLLPVSLGTLCVELLGGSWLMSLLGWSDIPWNTMTPLVLSPGVGCTPPSASVDCAGAALTSVATSLGMDSSTTVLGVGCGWLGLTLNFEMRDMSESTESVPMMTSNELSREGAIFASRGEAATKLFVAMPPTKRIIFTVDEYQHVLCIHSERRLTLMLKTGYFTWYIMIIFSRYSK